MEARLLHPHPDTCPVLKGALLTLQHSFSTGLGWQRLGVVTGCEGQQRLRHSWGCHYWCLHRGHIRGSLDLCGQPITCWHGPLFLQHSSSLGQGYSVGSGRQTHLREQRQLGPKPQGFHSINFGPDPAPDRVLMANEQRGSHASHLALALVPPSPTLLPAR